MVYIIDTYAWIEYFLASRKGQVLRDLLAEPTHQFLTVECCLAEIRGWSLRSKQDFSLLFKVVRANSQVIPVTEHDWIRAAEERFELRKTRSHFGLIDAVIIVKQKEFACKVVSGDAHFKGLKDIIFVE